VSSANFYETDRALSEYLLFHYGSSTETMPWSFGPTAALSFPARCISECLETSRLPAKARALDLGCAVGRATFELARHCTEVVGLDYSHGFIQAARYLQAHGSMDYEYVEEGLLMRSTTAEVPAGIERARVCFEQGDALALRADLGRFDVVLMANLLDRLREPRRCLATLPSLLRPGGQLIVTTPGTWLDQFTPPANWLGGFAHVGREVRTLATLQTTLETDFNLIRTLDMPFLIREHARKFQWSVAQATVWVRQN